MVEIFWTDESKKWLKEIYDYIVLDNEKIAKRVINEII
jgi:plasmid stabilization system protein ParE